MTVQRTAVGHYTVSGPSRGLHRAPIWCRPMGRPTAGPPARSRIHHRGRLCGLFRGEHRGRRPVHPAYGAQGNLLGLPDAAVPAVCRPVMPGLTPPPARSPTLRGGSPRPTRAPDGRRSSTSRAARRRSRCRSRWTPGSRRPSRRGLTPRSARWRGTGPGGRFRSGAGVGPVIRSRRRRMSSSPGTTESGTHGAGPEPAGRFRSRAFPHREVVPEPSLPAAHFGPLTSDRSVRACPALTHRAARLGSWSFRAVSPQDKP